MYLESLTVAKDPRSEQRNEDRFCVASGRFYAVIDGVTDKSGQRLPDGSSRGQEAGRLIERTLMSLSAELFTISAARLLEELSAAFAERYRELDELRAAEADTNLRFAAQLAVAVPGTLEERESWRLLLVGDCGIRVDGQRLYGHHQPTEEILARWRGLIVNHILKRGGSVAEALACGRHYCLEGSGTFEPNWEQLVSRSDWQRLRELAHTSLGRYLGEIPVSLLGEILDEGVKGASRFRNTAGPLGQACIDGFAVPLEKVVDVVVTCENATAAAKSVRGASARADSVSDSRLSSLELFSDGYFGTPPAGRVSVVDWERHLAEVERIDPLKIGPYPATKGSDAGAFSDDRTVLIIKPSAARATAAESHERDGGR